MKTSKGSGVGEWKIDGIVKEVDEGDPKVKSLLEENFINSYTKMANPPKMQIAAKIVRANGIPFLTDLFLEEDLIELKRQFEKRTDCTMTKDELKNFIYNQFDDSPVLNYYDKIFKLIDMDLDGVIAWEEMIGFLDTEMQERYKLVHGSIPVSQEEYIQGPTKEMPNRHNRPIAGIKFWPSVNKERKVEPGIGKYISVSDKWDVDLFNLYMAPCRRELAPSPSPQECRPEVKALCVLPDLNLICLGTVSRDLCFYEFKIDKMECVYHIKNLDSHPVSIAYKFYEDPSRRSFIAVGMIDGSVATVLFRTDDGGPFRKPPTSPFGTCSYRSIRMGRVNKLEARDFNKLHTHWIDSVCFVDAIDCLMTMSSSVPVSLALLDVEEQCVICSIEAPLGINCADLLPIPPQYSTLPLTNYEDAAKREDKRVFGWWLVTGGVDTRLRVWDLNHTRRPRVTLTGHISSVKFIIVQHNPVHDCPIIVSYGRIGRIKVWNGRTFEILQLYTHGLQDLKEDTPLTICYNSYYHVLLLCTYRILYVKIGKHVDECISSGNTESHEIVAALYNKHYDIIITATLGSIITIWNPETGDKQMMITNCHITNSVRGEEVAGITAAVFNPDGNLLATGAVDGSIKLWNFYRGIAVMDLEAHGPVRWLFWRRYGLLVISNDGKARLFSGNPLLNPGYRDYFLGNEVNTAAFVKPSYLVVGTFTGEIIFMDFATGNHIRSFKFSQKKMTNCILDWKIFNRFGGSGKICVETIYLMKRRSVTPEMGNLLVSLRTGIVQIWSTHPDGGYIDCFYAAHHSGDKVTGFTSDKNHNFLFTGTSYGYIKMWWIANFGIGREPGKKINPDSQYPFLSPDLADSLPAKMASREKNIPPLLNCYRAHSGSVSIILFHQNSRILMTAAMKAVRYWTLTGQFLNSFGCSLEWKYHSLSEPVQYDKIRIPSDLKRILSKTSLKVLTKDYKFVKSSIAEKSFQNVEDGGDDDKNEIVLDREDIVIPWKRADLKKLWQRVDQVCNDVKSIPGIPDMAQEQLYKNVMLHKTEKVHWIKPPKIVRSKRRRIALSLLYDDKKMCKECRSKVERTKHHFNKNMSLTEGVKQLVRKIKHKEDKQACEKCYWKSHSVKCKKRIDTLFDQDTLGKTHSEIAMNFGNLALVAATESFGDAYLFGKKIPKSESELSSFIPMIMEMKGIDNTSCNRKLISNLIKLEKRKAVLKQLEEFKGDDDKQLLNFDCFTLEEKRKIIEKGKNDMMDQRKGSVSGKSIQIPGIYSFLSNCLYGTEYSDIPDDQLIKLLTDLSKRLKTKKVESLSKQSYKRRFEWWERMKQEATWDTAKKIIPVRDEVKELVKSFTSDNVNMDSFKETFYETVSGHVQNILSNLTCSQCGGGMKDTSVSLLPEIRVQNDQKKELKRESKTNNKFNDLLKSYLARAPLGEIREEDGVNQILKFCNKIVNDIFPCCMKCMNQNLLDPSYSLHKEKTVKLLKSVDQAVGFCMPRELASEKKKLSEHYRSLVEQRRKEACDRMEKDAQEQKRKEINIKKLEERLEGLKNQMVSITRHDQAAKSRRLSIKRKIDLTKRQILQAYK